MDASNFTVICRKGEMDHHCKPNLLLQGKEGKLPPSVLRVYCLYLVVSLKELSGQKLQLR